MSEEQSPTAKNRRRPAKVPASAPAKASTGGARTAAKTSRSPASKPTRSATAKTSATATQKSSRPKKIRYSAAEIRALFERFRAANPAPKGELEHTNPFTLVVAVALSAQATDVSVNKATRELFRLADTPEKMVALGEYRVSDLIKTIGLFRTKAKNVIALSQLLIDRFNSEVPQTREDLVQLPGVGQKTANVVLNAAFGHSTIAVDTHIFRLANRLGIAPGRTPAAVEKALEAIIPMEFKRDSHHWLILHGRYVCKARAPDCSHCVIADLCKNPDKTCDTAYWPEPTVHPAAIVGTV
jgi:endonuclease-3